MKWIIPSYANCISLCERHREGMCLSHMCYAKWWQQSWNVQLAVKMTHSSAWMVQCTTGNSVCNDCFSSQEICPCIKMSLLSGTTAVRMQWSITNGIVLTLRMSLHQNSLQRDVTVSLVHHKYAVFTTVAVCAGQLHQKSPPRSMQIWLTETLESVRIRQSNIALRLRTLCAAGRYAC